MPCYHPNRAFVDGVTESGKKNLVWRRPSQGIVVEEELPCGQCIGCRLEYSRRWACRCMDEASLHEENCFLTLTFDEAHLPKDGSLDVSVFQKFMKRLRISRVRDLQAKHGNAWKKYFKPVRFYHCGEYGEKLGRPHYHALLFGHDFADKELFVMRNGNPFYVSKELDQVWQQGHALIGECTFDTAAYVARYVMKKITGAAAPAHYGNLKPEYVTMSRRPGIGTGWFEKFKGDVYPGDFKVVNGVKTRPPRFYDNLLQLEDPALFERLKARRREAAPKWERQKDGSFEKESSLYRLSVKEQVKLAQISSLKRPLEEF